MAWNSMNGASNMAAVTSEATFAAKRHGVELAQQAGKHADAAHAPLMTHRLLDTYR